MYAAAVFRQDSISVHFSALSTGGQSCPPKGPPCNAAPQQLQRSRCRPVHAERGGGTVPADHRRGIRCPEQRKPGDIKALRRGYSGLHDQEAALSALEKEVSMLRVGKVNHLYPFQKGILVTVRAARGLLADLKKKLGDDTYLLTRHLTQDRLEGFFGMVRGCGGSNQNPTPTYAKARLRLLTILMLMRHGVSPLCKAKEANSTFCGDEDGESMKSHDKRLAGQIDELCKELNVESESKLCGDIEGLVPHVVPEAEPVEDSEELAEMQALLEEADVCPAQPPDPSGAIDSETGVRASDSAMAHVAGFVARKRGPSLGTPSAFAEEDVPVEALWTRLKSVGGLTLPTHEFLNEFRQMDAEFCAHHAMEPDGLSRRPGVLRELIQILGEKHPNLSMEVIGTFVRVRTFIRLRHVNAGRRMESLVKRSIRKERHYAP